MDNWRLLVTPVEITEGADLGVAVAAPALQRE
jgi:hypothetical protein